jgi:hypothetical protein
MNTLGMTVVLMATMTMSALAPQALAAKAGGASSSTRNASNTVPAAAPPAPPSAEIATPFSSADAPSMKGVSAWGILPWGGIGVGARYMMPLAIGPLLTKTKLRDNFSLELGGDFLHFSTDVGVPGFSFNYSWNEVLPVAGMMWNIWFNPKLAIYPKVELGYVFAWVSGWRGFGGGQPGYGGVFADGAGGVLYRLDNGLTLRGEIGIAGLKLGAGWLF